jgi:NADH pyrophosphatase NudC (nudix superfamily)
MLFACRVVGGELKLDQDEVLGVRYFGPDELPTMRPCCVAKVEDAFSFQGRAFTR